MLDLDREILIFVKELREAQASQEQIDQVLSYKRVTPSEKQSVAHFNAWFDEIAQSWL